MKRISIGKFAKMSGLTIRALRHYDEEGLLKPADIDASSGYRYYLAAQISRAEQILLYRSLDLPLEEIRSLLSLNKEERVPVLMKQRSKLQSLLGTIQGQLDGMDELLGIREAPPYVVQQKALPAEKVLSIRATVPRLAASDMIYNSVLRLVGMSFTANNPPIAVPYTIYRSVFDEGDELDQQVCLPIARSMEVPEDVMCLESMPTSVVSTLHHGPYEEIPKANKALLEWMDEKGIEPSDVRREVYLIGPGQVRDPSAFQTEVQWVPASTLPVHRSA